MLSAAPAAGQPPPAQQQQQAQPQQQQLAVPDLSSLNPTPPQFIIPSSQLAPYPPGGVGQAPQGGQLMQTAGGQILQMTMNDAMAANLTASHVSSQRQALTFVHQRQNSAPPMTMHISFRVNP